MKKTVFAFLTVALVLLGAPHLSGQTFEIAANGGFQVLGGQDFDDTDSGFGGEVVARYLMTDRFSLGLGFLRSQHRLDPANADYTVPSVFVEPRYVFSPDRESVRPFLAVRGGWVRQSLGLTGPNRLADGVGIGLTTGLLIPLSSVVGVEAGVNVYQAWFGDFERSGVPEAGSDTSGQAYGIRLGFFWLGG